MKELLPYLALAVSCGALLLATLTFVRAGRWRESDDAKGLLTRVDETESRLDKLEERTRGLATKADIAGLKSELHGVCKQLDGEVVPGLRRIEDYFLKAGMER